MGTVHFDRRVMVCPECDHDTLSYDPDVGIEGRLRVPSKTEIKCEHCGCSANFEISPDGDVMVVEGRTEFEPNLKMALGDPT